MPIGLRYQYTALQQYPAGDSRRRLRLLEIAPGSFDDALNVNLREATILGAQSDPSYEALSYVWGPKDTSGVILIGENKQRFEISQALQTALQHLRLKDKMRTVWIDAICINQNDIPERNSQVSIMGDIYRCAHRVVVWLGPEKDDSSHAMHLLRVFGSKIQVDWGTYKITPATTAEQDNLHWADKFAPPPYDKKDYDALKSLFEREWFERLWIRQEIVLARQALVQCGDECIPWEVLRGVFLAISTKDATAALHNSEFGAWVNKMRATGRLRLVYQVCTTKSSQLDGLRYSFGNAMCQDPRDRIYAMLSLLYGKEKTLGITPDYSLEAQAVYKDVVLRYICTLGNLNILTQCEPVEPFDKPTWIPDWSQSGKSMSTLAILPAASSELLAQTEAHGDVLRVAGTTVDSVATVTNIRADRLETLVGAVRVLQDIVPADFTDKPYPTGSSYLEALIRLLTRDCLSDFLPIIQDAPMLSDAAETMKKILEVNDQALPGLLQDRSVAFLLGSVSESLTHYTFFSTTTGYIGLGRREQVKIGDFVCALLGSDMPVILRQHANSQCYLIGQSYVCGLMYGEAFLGPLPPKWRVSWKQGEGEGGQASLFRAYENLDTNGRQLEDPRMGKLASFLDLSHARHQWNQDEEHLIDASPDVLRQCGVNITWFDLI